MHASWVIAHHNVKDQVVTKMEEYFLHDMQKYSQDKMYQGKLSCLLKEG